MGSGAGVGEACVPSSMPCAEHAHRTARQHAHAACRVRCVHGISYMPHAHATLHDMHMHIHAHAACAFLLQRATYDEYGISYMRYMPHAHAHAAWRLS
jgi:hypothetical protein